MGIFPVSTIFPVQHAQKRSRFPIEETASAGCLVDRGTHQRAFQARLCQLVLTVVQVLSGKDLLGALLGSLRTRLIDVLGPFPSG